MIKVTIEIEEQQLETYLHNVQQIAGVIREKTVMTGVEHEQVSAGLLDIARHFKSLKSGDRKDPHRGLRDDA